MTYSPSTAARLQAEQAARQHIDQGHARAYLVGHRRGNGAYIETQDSAGNWREFWQELKQEPTA